MNTDQEVREVDEVWLHALDSMLRRELSNPRTMIVTGDFERGAVAELLPAGRARLSEARYTGRFAGLRDLSIEGETNHLHLDLGRIDRIAFRVIPSVCFGWKPSFDMVLEHRGMPALSLSLTDPHGAEGLDDRLITDFFVRWRRTRAAVGERVVMQLTTSPPSSRLGPKLAVCWLQVAACHAAARAASADAPSAEDDVVASEFTRLAKNAEENTMEKNND
jgi:hypothetical protein